MTFSNSNCEMLAREASKLPRKVWADSVTHSLESNSRAHSTMVGRTVIVPYQKCHTSCFRKPSTVCLSSFFGIVFVARYYDTHFLVAARTGFIPAVSKRTHCSQWQYYGAGGAEGG